MFDAGSAENLRKLDEALRLLPSGYNGYENKDRLRRDVAELLKTCKSLVPQTGSFAGQGQTATLFYLYGTLPITYRGATYNIPVTLYLDPPYPVRGPRCFVTPTAGMAVSQHHENVDQGGMVYMPYLSSWDRHQSSLTELVAHMSSIFSAKPPVHSTGGTGGGGASQSQQAQAQAGGLVGAISSLFGGQSQPQHQPPRPQGYSQPIQPVQPVVTPAYHPPGHAAPSGAAARPVVAAHVTATPVNPKAALVSQTEQALKDRWPFAVQPLVDQANAQLDKRRELREQARKVDEQLELLKAEEARCREQARQLDAVQPTLEAFVAEHEGKQASADQVLEQLDPDSRQVLDMLSEELALDELLNALDDLMAARKISVEDFMREVRDVGRRRFMCQAARKKCESALKGEAAAAAPVAAPAYAAPAAAAAYPVAHAVPVGAYPVARAVPA